MNLSKIKRIKGRDVAFLATIICHILFMNLIIFYGVPAMYAGYLSLSLIRLALLWVDLAILSFMMIFVTVLILGELRTRTIDLLQVLREETA